MTLGGRAVDGTETGWGRPAESAPRWRALLDRARLAGRGGEHPEPDERGGDPDHPTGRSGGNGVQGRVSVGESGTGSDPVYRTGRGTDSGYGRSSGSGYPPPAGPPAGAGRAPAPGYGGPQDPAQAPGYGRQDPSAPIRPRRSGYPARPDFPVESGYPTGPDHPSGQRPGAESGQPPGESRYALLENGYQPEPRQSRYALLDGYRTGPVAPPPVVAPPPAPAPAQSPPLHPGPERVPAPPPARRGHPPVPPQPGPDRARVTREAGYPARVEWQEGRPDSEVERAVSVLRRDLGTPRVLAFANPKGGVHKTTATVLGAATIGSVRGRGVLAWDDNELRGTLGLRAGSARHARTIRHLVADLLDVESRHGTDLTDRLDDYLRHASDGSYDVLAGEESPRFAQRLDQHTVRRVLELLRRTHDVICVDTGNNVESANWQTVLQAADQLVVTTVPREDAAFTADWMLDLLHDVGMGELADNAVTLLSCPTPGRSPLLDDLQRHFATRTRAVAVVPYDAALETGSSIEYHQLQDETRQAWLLAASVMVEPFAR
nr:ATPase [Micromonospora sp. DSM 115978]